MIIIYLKGGLGNQLFQYALGRAIENNGQQVFYDISSYNGYRHHYRLNCFATSISLLSPKEQKLFDELYVEKTSRLVGRKGLLFKVFRRILKHYDDLFYVYKSTIHERLIFDKRVFSVDSKVLEGYWANLRYSDQIKKQLMSEIVLQAGVQNDSFHAWKDRISLQPNSVSVHIRRGDYLDETNSKIFNSLNNQYYQEAIAEVSKKHKDAHFFVFSNDIAWCKKTWGSNPCFSIVSAQNQLLDVHDFSLMKQCRHNIIANSTFSLWAAYLNDNPNKIIVAPKKWYKNIKLQKRYEQGVLAPNNWLKI
jgi:hypothetical protein